MSPRRITPPNELLQHEFAQEMASALGRLGRALEAALAALAEFDNARDARSEPSDRLPASDREQRAALVAQAGVALWHFVVQREACGLRDMRYVLRDYRVPPEVAARMGLLPVAPPRAARHAADLPVNSRAERVAPSMTPSKAEGQKEKSMSVSVGKLDHYNVSTRKLGDTVRFYEDILGLVNGPRPPFDFPGAWLYSDGHPVLHLNDISPTDRQQRPDSGVIDHIAFGSRGFEEMKQRLAQKSVEYQVRVVPNSTRRQIFLTDPNNVLIELNFDIASGG